MSKLESYWAGLAVGAVLSTGSFLRGLWPRGRRPLATAHDGRADRDLRFLIQASELLASSLEYETTLQSIADLAVPAFADWCAARVLDEQGEFEPVALAFADPRKLPLAQDLFRLYPAPREVPYGPGAVVRTGKPDFRPEITDAGLVRAAQDEKHLRLMRAVGMRSYLCVPMEAEGQRLGTISWIISDSDRRFSEADVTVASDLARRAALAIRSARHLRQTQQALQRLEQSQALAEALLAAAPFGVALLDRDLKYLCVNRLLGQLNARAPDAHIGRSVEEVLGASATPLLPMLRQVIETGQPIINWEYQGRAPGLPDESRHWSATYYPAVSNAGQVLGLGAIVDDITERKRTRERLVESLALIESLVEGSPIAIAFLDRDLRYLRLNEAMAAINGKPVSEHLGRSFREVLPEAASLFEADLRAVIETGRPSLNLVFEGEMPGRPERRGRWVGNWYPVRAEDGRVLGVGVMTVEITEQMLVEEALRQSERRYRVLTDAVVQLMWANDPNGNTVFVNRRWEEFSGLSLEEVLTLGWLKLVHPDDLSFVLKTRTKAIETGTPYDMEYRLRARDGSYRWHIIRTVPFLDARGRLEGWFGTATDIHELKTAEESLQAARDAAEAASQAKSQFLAVLSHELRNPLAPALISVASLLDDPETPEAMRPSLEIARRNIELETRLIDDLLDVTRIAQDKLRLDRTPVDTHEIINRAVEICRDDIARKSLSLAVDLSAPQSWVQADPARLQQVVWNLLKNAAKFTPEGGSITLRTMNQAGSLVVEVTDTGLGIEPGAIPKIFAAFEQSDPSITRQFGGLGLGLAISRSLVEAMDGTLDAHSDGRGRGARFVLTLPASPPPPLASARPSGASQSLESLSILLVEDNADSLALLTRLFRNRGHRVLPASSLAEARSAVESNAVDLVVSDIGLPDGSGQDLLRELRGRVRRGAIALSGFGTDADRQRSQEAGFNVHLTKPVDFDKLQTAIRQIVSAG